MSFISSPVMVLGFIVSALTINVVWAGDTTLLDVVTLPYSIKKAASDSTWEIWIFGHWGLQYMILRR